MKLEIEICEMCGAEEVDGAVCQDCDRTICEDCMSVVVAGICQDCADEREA